MITGTDNQLVGHTGKSTKKPEDIQPDSEKSTLFNLLKLAGTWQGDDIKECLEAVYKIRGETQF